MQIIISGEDLAKASSDSVECLVMLMKEIAAPGGKEATPSPAVPEKVQAVPVAEAPAPKAKTKPKAEKPAPAPVKESEAPAEAPAAEPEPVKAEEPVKAPAKDRDALAKQIIWYCHENGTDAVHKAITALGKESLKELSAEDMEKVISEVGIDG